jgi:hypothetical protein
MAFYFLRLGRSYGKAGSCLLSPGAYIAATRSNLLQRNEALTVRWSVLEAFLTVHGKKFKTRLKLFLHSLRGVPGYESGAGEACRPLCVVRAVIIIGSGWEFLCLELPW